MIRDCVRGARSGLALFSVICLLVILLNYAPDTEGQPTGVNFTFNATQEINATPAGSIVTAGGSFTTLILNGSFQTQEWKAYVGNISGAITLDDGNTKTIYDWQLVSVSGEVYVSRNGSIQWGTIGCANATRISAEMGFLNMNASGSDSLNRTFNQTIHRSFFVGTTNISNSTCRAIATYVNDTRQAPSESARFQEILLQDSPGNVVYATILEDAQAGYDLGLYDFQLIVAEDETKVSPTPYYFYAEIS